MPTIYKVTGKNSGKDVSVTITDSRGRQVNIAQILILTHFEVEADYTMWETKSIINGGQCFYESLPHGSRCVIKGSRYNSGLEDLESAYRRASRNGEQLVYRVQYQTRNRDNTINTRQLVDCKPHNFKLGAYGADKDVEQSVEFVSGDIDENGGNTGLFG